MRFRSTYVDQAGSTVTAVLEAPDEQSLHEDLHRGGCTLVRARPVTAPSEGPRDRLRPARLLLFLQSLQNALDAGVPMLAALTALREQEADPACARVHADLADRIAGGQPLSEAMAAHPRSFSPVMCALVRVGESSGNLPEVLGSMVGLLEWRLSIAATVRQAAIYPAIVFAAGYALVLFLLAFVLPQLGGVLEKIGSELPAASRLLIDLSRAVAGNVGWVLLATALLLALAWAALRTQRGRALCLRSLGHLPVAREVVRTLDLVQLCRNLAVMLHAGLTLPMAIEHAAGGLPRLGAALLRVRDRVLGGGNLTEVLAEHAVLPPVAVSMVRVGEDTGRLAQAFERLARSYDREVRAAVKRALGLLEPVVTILLGVVVGGVAVLVITTVYSALRGLGR